MTTAILDIQAARRRASAASSARVNVDMIYSDNALPPTSFRTTDVSNLADSIFLGSGSLFTGQLVRYTTAGAAIGGLINGNYYVVVRSADGASIRLATRAADGSLTAARARPDAPRPPPPCTR